MHLRFINKTSTTLEGQTYNESSGKGGNFTVCVQWVDTTVISFFESREYVVERIFAVSYLIYVYSK